MPINPTLATKHPAVLLDRIKKEFPDLTWTKFEFIDAGWDHEVIWLDGKYIFRFPNSPEYLSLLKDEIALLSYLLSRTKARIPKYSYVAKDFSFGGYEILAGEELSLERFTSLTQEQQRKVAHAIAGFLTDLHSVDTASLGEFNIGTEPDFAGYDGIAAEAEEYLRPNLPNEQYQVVVKMLNDVMPAQKLAQPARLIHDDIAPKHLIWDSGMETVGFIDFSDRVISDPAYDFAELYTYGETFVNQVYELYGGPDKDEHFLVRARAYMKAIGIHSLANTYRTDKMQHTEAMRLFEIGSSLPA